jgi:single-stranded-DNA-specific exonuclease
MLLFDRILAARGLNGKSKAAFLLPDYSDTSDPFLLNDMDKAVKRIVIAREKQEKIVIYGDYDIDGLTAATLLYDALGSFGFKYVEIFIPNRFEEGYGLTVDAIDKIASGGTNLIITVDCGSTSIKEIIRAGEQNVDVIVTDHHNISKKLPLAFAVINPKRLDNKYPFVELAGVGVAFKLVQALQIKFNGNPSTGSGLPFGQEKWLLDLVALGTVCDIVPMVDENRTNVYWGLKVLAQTKRPGLKALMAIAGIDPKNINARSIGFGLGPRMNAAGRLETAQHALEMLVATDPMLALAKAEYLDSLNKSRRIEQDKIYKDAIIQAEKYATDHVLVVSNADWNHGVVGIVASKLLEKYKKPTYVLQEIGNESKGSARSYGDFSAIDAINSVQDLINKGGGHKFAAGVTMPTKNIAKFRKRVNDYYRQQKLGDQKSLLLPKADALAELSEITEELVELIAGLEPFGIGNPQPIIKTDNLKVVGVRKMGADSQHVKLDLQDNTGIKMQFLAFNAPNEYFAEIGTEISVWFHPNINEWRGRRTVEGQLAHIEVHKK